jgi:hypothetical protein
LCRVYRFSTEVFSVGNEFSTEVFSLPTEKTSVEKTSVEKTVYRQTQSGMVALFFLVPKLRLGMHVSTLRV